MRENRIKYLVPIRYFKTAMLLLVLFLLVFTGCGKKGPPIPPKAYIPPAVNDLTAGVDKDLVKLTWTTVLDKKQSHMDDSVFVIYGSKQSLDSDPCKGCPKIFKPIAKTPFNVHAEAIKTGGMLTRLIQLDHGFRYEIKLKIEMGNNVAGPFSNTVSVDIP